MSRAIPKFVLLAFERTDHPEKYVTLKNFIKNDEKIEAWWHYLPACYILKTTLSIEHLTDNFLEVMGDERFFIIEVKLDSCNGWLPEKAWKWIHEHSKDVYFA